MDQHLEVLLAIKGDVGLLHGKIDGILANHARLAKAVTAQETRITDMDKTSARRGGMIAVVAAVVTLVASRGANWWSGI